jgi:hypothetical protein
MKEVIIKCDCGTHLLMVQSDKEDKYHAFYLAMFGYGSQKRNLWNRIKIAFRILRTGKVYSDQLVLTPEEATKLLSFLVENLNYTGVLTKTA